MGNEFHSTATATLLGHCILLTMLGTLHSVELPERHRPLVRIQPSLKADTIWVGLGGHSCRIEI